MPTPPQWRSPRIYLVPVFAGALLLALALLLSWPQPSPVAAHAGPDPAPIRHAPVAATTADADSAAGTSSRQDATPEPATEPSFEDRIDELVQIGRRTAELAQQDEVDAAKAADQQARARFGELMERFEDAGERALALLTTLAEPAAGPSSNGRRIVLQLVVKTECERRDHAAEAAHDRSRIDAFVQAVLDVMPTSTHSAEVGEAALVNQRFLRAAHEPAVLGLVQLAAEQRFPRAIATQILLTLWDNLQQFGERSSEELSRLALLLLADSDASQRTAACRQLLKDARYRNLVLAWLRERGDRAVANEVAGIAARELPVAEALAVLRELSATLPRAPNAYLVLGFRAPDAIADSYRELLAANTHSDVRCDLITGIGMTRTPLGLEIAQLALHDDPSPAARIQAVFALTAQGEVAHGEAAITTALDDPGIANDPTHLGALVLALQNLEAAGDANAIERVARRLQALPLPDSARQTLAAMLQRCLPSSQPSPPGSGGR